MSCCVVTYVNVIVSVCVICCGVDVIEQCAVSMRYCVVPCVDVIKQCGVLCGAMY